MARLLEKISLNLGLFLALPRSRFRVSMLMHQTSANASAMTSTAP